MEALGTLYLILLPLVLGAALIEGLWLLAHAGRRLRLEGVGDLARRSYRAPAARLHPLQPRHAGASPGPTTTAFSRRVSIRSSGCCCSSSAWNSSITGFIAPATPCAGFWNTHSVHHSPNRFTLSAAYRLGWLGKFSGATIFFTPMAFLGFEPVTILSALFLNLLYQFWIHADWIPKLGVLEYVLNTPSAHRVHHARNPNISTPTSAAC